MQYVLTKRMRRGLARAASPVMLAGFAVGLWGAADVAWADTTSFKEDAALTSSEHRRAAPVTRAPEPQRAARSAVVRRPIAHSLPKAFKSAPAVALLQPIEPAVAPVAQPAPVPVAAVPAPLLPPKHIASLPPPREVKVEPKVPTPLVRNMLVYQSGVASFYAGGEITANGERYNKNGLTAAHRTLPLGSVLLVTHEASGRSVVLRVNDRGPYIDGRILDLSAGAARVLGMSGNGIARVRIIVLSVGVDEQLPEDVRGVAVPARPVPTQTTEALNGDAPGVKLSAKAH